MVRIKWTEQFTLDLNTICDYIVQNPTIYAEFQFIKVKQRA